MIHLRELAARAAALAAIVAVAGCGGGGGGGSTKVVSPPTPTIPAAPTGFTATPVSAFEIDLAWTDSASDELGFKVQKSLNGLVFTHLALLPVNSSTTADVGLTPATTYHYRVAAFNAVGDSAFLTASATTPAAPAGTVTVAQQLDSPWDVAVDSSHIYWVENNVVGGALKRVRIGGGGLETLQNNLVEPTAIALDSAFVYWLERNNGSNGSLRRMPKIGGSVTTLANGLRNAQNHIALDSDNIYFGDGKSGGGGAIRRVAKNGIGGVITLVDSGIINLEPAVATDGTLVWFTNDQGSILTVPVGGGSVSTFTAGDPSTIILDSTNVYWTEFGAGEIKKKPKVGGSATVIASGSSPSGLATDGTNVYWTEFTNPGQVNKVSVNGGGVTTISNASNAIGVAVDGTFVYWVENVFVNGGKVQMKQK